MSQTFYLLSGIHNSGKSTYAVRLREIICASAEHPQIFEEGAESSMYRHLSQGWTAIYDALNLSPTLRKWYCLRAKEAAPDCTCICIYFLTPAKICIARNQLIDNPIDDSIIIEQALSQSIPSFDEGWHRIYRPPIALEQDCSIDLHIVFPEFRTERPLHQSQS